MTQKPLTLARLAGQYGLKTLDADIAAKKLGLNLRRGAALVRPWQERKLRPELERMRAYKESWSYLDEDAVLADYRAADDHSYADDGIGRLGFSNTQMAEQLAPILEKMQREEGEGSANSAN